LLANARYVAGEGDLGRFTSWFDALEKVPRLHVHAAIMETEQPWWGTLDDLY
jgi:hypothetical protein